MRRLGMFLVCASVVLASEGLAPSPAVGTSKASNYRAVILANNPIMYWRLGETSGTVAYDETANNRDAIISKKPLLKLPGAIKNDPNTSIWFDGLDDAAGWNATSSYSGSFTVEAWIRPAATGVPTDFFGTRFPGEYSFDFKIMSGNQLSADVGDGSRWLITGATARFVYSPGVWYYVAAVVTPRGVALLANGKLLRFFSYGGTPLLFDSSHGVLIGESGPSGSQEWFLGRIDEVAVYPRALSIQTIAAHHNAGLQAHR